MKQEINAKTYFLLITTTIFLTTVLHYGNVGPSSLHDLYRELYYFPIFIGAFRFGFKGAVFTVSAINFLYIPYVIFTWNGALLDESERILEIMYYVMFGLVSGYIVERERKTRSELEKNRFIISLGRITSTIVHDLKNPLNTTIGLLERLAKGKGDPQKYIPVVLDDVHKMERIVYGVLDFAKPLNLRKESTNLAEIVSQAVQICMGKAASFQVTIDTEFEDIVKMIDPFLIERAVMNIVSNAIEASRAGQKITVKLKKGENGKSIIRVRDQGPGMDKEALKHCFDIYYTSKKEGTGFGLCIVKKIIEAHQAKIQIESSLGKGTEIRIILP